MDLSRFLNLTGEDGRCVECWIIDGRRPWNLFNVYTGLPVGYEGKHMREDGRVDGGRYGVGDRIGGIKCFDDGDIEEDMKGEGTAFKALVEMPEVDSEDESDSESEPGDDNAGSGDDDEGGAPLGVQVPNGRKRKSSDEPEDEDSDEENGRSRPRARVRRDSNEVCAPSKQFLRSGSNQQSSRVPPPRLCVPTPYSLTSSSPLPHQHAPTLPRHLPRSNSPPLLCDYHPQPKHSAGSSNV